MTFALSTARRHLRPRFWLELQGIEQVLVEEPMTAAVVDSRTQLATVIDLVPGESRLDFDALAESGASLTATLRDTAARDLRALFATRTRRAARLDDSFARGDTPTSVLVDAGGYAALPSSGTLYIGAETFAYTGKSGGDTLTGVTRALYGSRAQDQLAGAGIWVVPPTWVGRRATLRCAYLDEQGGASAAESAALGTFRFEQAPQFLGADRWELRCGELHTAFAEARCYIGQREVTPAGDGETAVDGEGVSVVVDTADAFLFAVATRATQVRLAVDETAIVLPDLLEADSSSVTVDRFSDRVVRSRALLAGVRPVESLQHVAYLTGKPARIVLELLLSRLGDGENDATYDVLPGRLREAYGREEWRFGAGLRPEDVDIPAFEALFGAGPTWTILLEEELTVGDLLSEMCQATETYWRVSSAGQLTVRRLRDKADSSAMSPALAALNDDHLLDGDEESLVTEPRTVVTGVSIDLNWEPLSGRFLTRVEAIDHELAALFTDEVGGRLELSSKALSVFDGALRTADAPYTMRRASPMATADLLLMLRRRMLASARARAFASMRFAWAAALVEPGDFVRVTNPRVPSLEGGALSATPCLVLGKQLDLDQAQVMLSLQIVDRAFQVAPCGVVLSWNAGLLRAQLNDPDITGASPGDSFAAGWTIEIVDVSATPNTVETLTIASVTSSSITFTGAPSFTPAFGDLILPTAQAGQAAAVSGYAPADFAYQVPDAGTLDVDDVSDPRWS